MDSLSDSLVNVFIEIGKDSKKLSHQVEISDTEPTSSDKPKIWIDTKSNPEANPKYTYTKEEIDTKIANLINSLQNAEEVEF